LFKNIPGKAVRKMSQLGSRPHNIICAIGPHIRRCCYEVTRSLSDSFADKLKGFDGHFSAKNSSYFLDLTSIAIYLLTESGIRHGNIDDLGICTFCSPGFESFRREKNEFSNYSFIWLE
jgi:copper oxidase (laccase) domain-containing protein